LLDVQKLRADAVAGITTAVSQVPDSMASAVMAGLSPAHGLHAAMVSAPAGALTTSSAYMMVTTTGAMSLAAGAALAGLPADQKLAGALVLTILVGLFQLAAGFARLGFVTHYVSNAVMTGFLSGVAVLIVLTQLEPLTGLALQSPKALQPLEIVRRFGEIAPTAVIVGAAMMALTLGLQRTPASKLAMLLALVIVSLGVALIDLGRVQLVGEVSAIPRGLPKWSNLADLKFLQHAPALATSALAVAIIGLVQGAAVSQGYPNPDGRYGEPSRDFLGQGVANLAAAAFTGMPVGGSAGATSLNVAAGAATRWAAVMSGVFLLLAVLVFAPLIERVPTAALAGLLVLAGMGSLNPGRILTVWRTGGVARGVMVLTFVATLLLPVQQAVFLGVAVSFVLAFVRQAERVRLKEMEFTPTTSGGLVLPRERPAPQQLRGDAVTALIPYGSLSFAGARTLEDSLPQPGADRAVVVLLLRGQREVGSTFIGVVQRYAAALKARGGRLMLAGVNRDILAQLHRTGTVDLLGEDAVLAGTQEVGRAALEAVQLGQAWLDRTRPGGEATRGETTPGAAPPA